MKAIVEVVLHVTSLSTSLKLKKNINVIMFNIIKKFQYLNVALKIGSQQIFKVLVSGFKFYASQRSHMQMSCPLHE